MDKTIVSIIAGLGGMFGWGTSDFFANLSSDELGNFKTFFWSQLVGMIFSLILVPIFGITLDLPLLFSLLLMVASVFYAGAYLLFYRAFEIGNVSIVSATINLYAVFTMIFAFIFLGQRLSQLQFLAVLMIIFGVTLVSLQFSDLKNEKIKLLAGVKETLLAALLFGVFWNLSEVISEQTGWLATTLLVKMGAILFLLLSSGFIKREISLVKTNLKIKFIVALVGILEAIAVVSVNYGLEVGDVILVTPIASALSIVTISMAIIFLKEKINATQGLGILLAVAGIVLTAF